MDYEEESKFLYILPDALGSRQELTLGLKHHTLAELQGQLATLLARHPTGNNSTIANLAGMTAFSHFLHTFNCDYEVV